MNLSVIRPPLHLETKTKANIFKTGQLWVHGFSQYIQQGLEKSVINCLSKLCMQDYKRRGTILQGNCNFTTKCSIIIVTKKRSNCFHKQKPTLLSVTKEKMIKQSISSCSFLVGTVEEPQYSQCKQVQKILLSHMVTGSRLSFLAPSLCTGLEKVMIPLFSNTEHHMNFSPTAHL